MYENLPPRIKYWLTEAHLFDCYFVVGQTNGQKERIGAIKALLMGDSEPFRAMLHDSELAEKGDIHVTDVEPETFRNFLICVYGGIHSIIQDITFEECAKLLYVSEKYLVQTQVKTQLARRLKELFSQDKIYAALSQPICYQQKILQKEIQDYLKLPCNDVIMRDEFMNLSSVAIVWILQQECFCEKEIEIWNAVLRWARNKTGSTDAKVLRPHILDFLKYIRFLTMDHKEFWNFVVSSGILLEEEVSDICRALVSGGPCSIENLSNNRSNRSNTESVGMPANKLFTSSFTVSTNRCAFIHCSVSSIGDLQRYNQYSETYHWAGYFWNLVLKKYNPGMSRPRPTGECLGVFVGCMGQTSNWNCETDIVVTLVNQTDKSDYSLKCTTNYSSCQSDWGWQAFYSSNEIFNESNGFIKDNKIILLAKINLKDTQPQA